MSDAPKLVLDINKFFFEQCGYFYLGNLTSSGEVLRKHFIKGINEFEKFDLGRKFGSIEKKSVALIDEISRLIQEKNITSVALLFSGGRDSALLAKCLSYNGVDVIAYHAFKHTVDHPKSRKKLDSLHGIFKKTGVQELQIFYGGVSPDNLLKAFNGEYLPAPAASACANIFLNTNISSHRYISFAQGADTLSNTVHNQHKYYNIEKGASLFEIKSILRRMYVTTHPKVFKLFALSTINRIILQSESNLNSLKGAEIQNVSRLIGMHLVHTPLDSKFIYDLASINNQLVFNPFHTLEVEKLFMNSVDSRNNSSNIDKHEINSCLEKFGLKNLEFERAGFKVDRILEDGRAVSDKVFFKNLYIKLLELKRNQEFN